MSCCVCVVQFINQKSFFFFLLLLDLHKRQFISISFKESFEGVAVDGIVSFGRYVRWLILNRAISVSLSFSVVNEELFCGSLFLIFLIFFSRV